MSKNVPPILKESVVELVRNTIVSISTENNHIIKIEGWYLHANVTVKPLVIYLNEDDNDA